MTKIDFGFWGNCRPYRGRKVASDAKMAVWLTTNFDGSITFVVSYRCTTTNAIKYFHHNFPKRKIVKYLMSSRNRLDLSIDDIKNIDFDYQYNLL